MPNEALWLVLQYFYCAIRPKNCHNFCFVLLNELFLVIHTFICLCVELSEKENKVGSGRTIFHLPTAKIIYCRLLYPFPSLNLNILHIFHSHLVQASPQLERSLKSEVINSYHLIKPHSNIKFWNLVKNFYHPTKPQNNIIIA